VKELLPVEYVDPRSLVPHASNPAEHPTKQKAAIQKSLEEFGWVAPVVVSRGTGTILDGHARVEEALTQEWPLVPVRYLDVTPAEEKKVLVAINRTGELRGVDEDRLLEVLTSLKEETGEFAPGYDAEDFAAKIGALREEIEGMGDAEEEPEAEDAADVEAALEAAPARCEPGDLWALGPHRLWVGDCRDALGMKRLLSGEKVNLIFTSPPYASQRKYDESSGFTPIAPEAYSGWWQDVQRIFALHLADDGSYFLNIKEHTDRGQRHLYVKDLVLAHVREWGWRFVDELIWHRQGWPGKYEGRFKNEFEPIFHFSLSPRIKFYPDRVKHDYSSLTVEGDFSKHRTPTAVPSAFYNLKLHKEEDGALPGNVLRIAHGSNAAQTGAMHGATFPTALPTFFLRAFSDAGDLVLDPFLGSGTTLLASEKEARKCCGSEISAQYADVTLARWERLTGRAPELLERSA
jgi:DNA modification methylase